MKYILFSIIFIFICLLSVSGFAEEWEIQESLLISIYNLEGGRVFLQKVINQINEDQEEINQLRYQRDKLREDIYVIRTQMKSLDTDLRKTKGLFFGAVIGYPFFTGMAMLEYRFTRWSPVIIGGYSDKMFIAAGINIKVGK